MHVTRSRMLVSFESSNHRAPALVNTHSELARQAQVTCLAAREAEAPESELSCDELGSGRQMIGAPL